MAMMDKKTKAAKFTSMTMERLNQPIILESDTTLSLRDRIRDKPIAIRCKDMENEVVKSDPLTIKQKNFPALPFAPHKYELGENRLIQRAVANEFIDFLDSVCDLINLLTMVKTRHLKSPVPLPPEVIREIHYLPNAKKMGPKMKAFEKSITSRIAADMRLDKGDTSSLFSVKSNSSGAGRGSQMKKSVSSTIHQGAHASGMKSNNAITKCATPYPASPEGSVMSFTSTSTKYSTSVMRAPVSGTTTAGASVATIGGASGATLTSPTKSACFSAMERIFSKDFARRTKPIWQVVESGKEDQAYLEQKMIAKHRKELAAKKVGPGMDKFVQKPRDLRKTMSKRLGEYIAYSRTKDMEPKTETLSHQMDLFQAYSDGFTSLDDWRIHTAGTRPHWFKELFEEAVSLCVVVTKDVLLGFQKLGKFYEVNFKRIHVPRAKLCMIVQSLPIWDIARGTMQRALDFVLRHILKSETVDKDINKWLGVRKIQRLTLPPIQGDEMSVVSEKRGLDKSQLDLLDKSRRRASQSESKISMMSKKSSKSSQLSRTPSEGLHSDIYSQLQAERAEMRSQHSIVFSEISQTSKKSGIMRKQTQEPGMMRKQTQEDMASIGSLDRTFDAISRAQALIEKYKERQAEDAKKRGKSRSVAPTRAPDPDE